MKATYRNFFENTATVQLDHRVLALSTLGAVGGTLALARRGQVWAALPPQTRTALTATAGMAGAGSGSLGGVTAANAIGASPSGASDSGWAGAAAISSGGGRTSSTTVASWGGTTVLTGFASTTSGAVCSAATISSNWLMTAGKK